MFQSLFAWCLLFPTATSIVCPGRVDEVTLKFIYLLDVSQTAGGNIEFPGVDLPTLLYGLENRLGTEYVEYALLSSCNKYNPPREMDNFCYRVAQYFEPNSADEIMRLVSTYMSPRETSFQTSMMDAFLMGLGEPNFHWLKDPTHWNELRVFFIDTHSRFAHSGYSREPFDSFEPASPYKSCEATNYPDIALVNEIAIRRQVNLFVAASGSYQQLEGPSWAEFEAQTDFPVNVFYGQDPIILANQIVNAIATLACPKVPPIVAKTTTLPTIGGEGVADSSTRTTTTSCIEGEMECPCYRHFVETLESVEI